MAPRRRGGRVRRTGRADCAAVDELLRALSRVVLVDRTLEDVLGEITSIAKRGIPGAEAVSITLLRNDKAFTAAYDGAMSLAADELQYERGYGPCMDAGRGGVCCASTTWRPRNGGRTTWPTCAPRRRSAARCRCRCPTRARPSGR